MWPNAAKALEPEHVSVTHWPQAEHGVFEIACKTGCYGVARNVHCDSRTAEFGIQTTRAKQATLLHRTAEFVSVELNLKLQNGA